MADLVKHLTECSFHAFRSVLVFICGLDKKHRATLSKNMIFYQIDSLLGSTDPPPLQR